MSLWDVLRAFTEDSALLNGDVSLPNGESLDDGDSGSYGVRAPLTCEQLLVAYPFTTLFDALKDATVTGDIGHVCMKCACMGFV